VVRRPLDWDRPDHLESMTPPTDYEPEGGIEAMGILGENRPQCNVCVEYLLPTEDIFAEDSESDVCCLNLGQDIKQAASVDGTIEGSVMTPLTEEIVPDLAHGLFVAGTDMDANIAFVDTLKPVLIRHRDFTGYARSRDQVAPGHWDESSSPRKWVAGPKDVCQENNYKQCENVRAKAPKRPPPGYVPKPRWTPPPPVRSERNFDMDMFGHRGGFGEFMLGGANDMEALLRYLNMGRMHHIPRHMAGNTYEAHGRLAESDSSGDGEIGWGPHDRPGGKSRGESGGGK